MITKLFKHFNDHIKILKIKYYFIFENSYINKILSYFTSFTSFSSFTTFTNNIIDLESDSSESDSSESDNSILKTINSLEFKSKHALLVGINYINTTCQLKGCINDINEVRNILISHCFNSSSITILTDDQEHLNNITNLENIKPPTKNNILNEFKKLLQNSNIGDILFFQYSGHGVLIPDTIGHKINNNDEAIYCSDDLIILDYEFKNYIDKYLKKGVTLIALFDACYSGSILDLRYQYMDSLHANKLTINFKESLTKGDVIMISGCDDTQTSADALINGKYDGAMTYYFLDTLKTYANNNEVLTWRTLIQNMRDLLALNNFKQIPQISSGKLINLDSTVFL
jgi:hypothetical protein